MSLAWVIRFLAAPSAEGVVKFNAQLSWQNTHLVLDREPNLAIVFGVAVNLFIHALALTTRFGAGVQKVSCMLSCRLTRAIRVTVWARIVVVT